MAIPSRDRFLYLGGSVENARARARFLALVATLIYAACLFAAVMLAHRLMDSGQISVPGAGSSIAQSQVYRC